MTFIPQWRRYRCLRLRVHYLTIPRFGGDVVVVVTMGGVFWW